MAQEKSKDKEPVLGRLKALEVGESACWPISRTSYVRSVSVTFGAEWGKRFRTAVDRKAGTITATRTV